jgi:N-acyl-D-aspartate/D-glutamate deacylase
MMRPGAKADLVLFDPAKVHADYVHPTRQAEGFDPVVVNGRPAFEGGEAVGRAGELLRRDG